MTLRILTTLSLLTLTAALSAGLLHAQGLAESEQAPYRIDLFPGWNLISFPGDPVDATLESVIGDAEVDMILGYQDGEWLAAVRKTDGGWRTTSGFTTLSGGWGYWLHAPTADALEVTLAQSDVSPFLKMTAGWNLIGVWDTEQRLPSTEIAADGYFAQIDWRVAYSFNTDANRWAKQLPRLDGTVETGAGYWVWATTPDPCPVLTTLIRRGGGTAVEAGAGYRAQALGGLALSCP